MSFYLVLALIGTVLFGIKLIMTLGGFDIDMVDMDDIHHGDVDTTESFQLLSYQSVLAFLMTFGWAGMALSNEFGLNPLETFAGASVMGLIGALVSSGSMYLLKNLDHSTQFTKPEVGAVGRVYFRIPPKGEGRGKVLMDVNGRLVEFDATSESEALESQTLIEVVNNDSDLVVKSFNQ